MPQYEQTHLVESYIREQRFSLLVGHRRMDDNIVALLPVDGGCDAVLVAELERCSITSISNTADEFGASYNPQLCKAQVSSWLSGSQYQTYRRISSKLRPVDAG